MRPKIRPGVMSKEYPGLPKAVARFISGYLAGGLLNTVFAIFVGSVALLFSIIVYPDLTGYMIIALASMVVSKTAHSLERNQQANNDSSKYNDLSQQQLYRLLITMTMIVIGTVSTVLVFSGIFAYVTAEIVGFPVLAILVAAVYPYFDEVLGETMYNTTGKLISARGMGFFAVHYSIQFYDHLIELYSTTTGTTASISEEYEKNVEEMLRGRDGHLF